ncbi:MAG: carboxypeptidase regulatory-like domain-containing protein [Chloroflexi bacterium]|nr:carboxypeptidase regulatory-like domain-containing protein [Chloroflexota bacterium]
MQTIHNARDRRYARRSWLALLGLAAACLLWLALRVDVRAAGTPGPTGAGVRVAAVITDSWSAPLPSLTARARPSPIVTEPGSAPSPVVTLTATPVPPATLFTPAAATRSPLPAATPTPASTVEPGGTVSGRIALQGWRAASAISLSAAPGGFSATVTNAGDFQLALPPGTYTLTARTSGFYGAQRTGVVVRPGQDTQLPPVKLLRGAISGSGTLSLADVALVAGQVGRASGFDPRADVNGDGEVNILDLILISGNIGKPVVQPWGD